MKHHTLVTLAFLLGCTGTVTPTALDASHQDGAADRASPGDVGDVVDASDVVDAPDAGRCPPTLPDGGAVPPPPGVQRSCGPGAAPSWHCDEVAYCGGEFVMGSTDAAQVHGQSDRSTYRMRECDPRRRVVRGGYIDAYEVTVARYRAWVRAGMPHPASYEYAYPYLEWTLAFSILPQGYVSSGDGDTVVGSPATLQNCTWSPTDGVNDDLPINCVDWNHAVAFCWWDGRHVVSEEAWEYLASNYGTTTSIRPQDLTRPESCVLGDLNSRNGICPRRDLPQPVNAFPLSGPPSVPGLFGMIGGVMEFGAGPPTPMDGLCSAGGMPTEQCCGRRYPATDDHVPREGSARRGASWWLDEEDQRWMNHVSSRYNSGRTPPVGSSRPFRSPGLGIRCARWVPGVW